MESGLEHEDLIIKLRAKLKEDNVQLWKPPYTSNDNDITERLQELADKYSTFLSMEKEVVLSGLYELQQHSLERLKANEDFKETGIATYRVKLTLTGQKPQAINIQKRQNEMGKELIDALANIAGVDSQRVKLIYNGKLIKPTTTLEEQGLKNDVQLMALVMAESQEKLVKEDKLYLEMKSTLADATLLSEHVSYLDDEDYMNLEDQSGKTIELPPAERRSLMVGLALHERGRAAAKDHNHSLALVLFLEADRLFDECSSSLLHAVDNWAVLQLDIAWSYLCLRALPSAGDAAQRLARAENAFRASYGHGHERLIALKGTAANERVLLMRLYLLQGIVAYHQNKRAEARRLLDRAEQELGSLKVDENAVTALLELGWTHAQARTGLRAAGGDLDRAHHYLDDRRQERERAREKNRQEKSRRAAAGGAAANAALVRALQDMGFSRELAERALRLADNHVADAVRLIQDQPDLLIESNEEPETPSFEDLPGEVDNELVTELQAMGYAAEEAALALRAARNRLGGAAALLAAAAERLRDPSDAAGASTSRDAPENGSKILRKYLKRELAKRREREAALARLAGALHDDEDGHLDAALLDEEQFLAQYKSLL